MHLGNDQNKQNPVLSKNDENIKFRKLLCSWVMYWRWESATQPFANGKIDGSP